MSWIPNRWTTKCAGLVGDVEDLGRAQFGWKISEGTKLLQRGSGEGMAHTMLHVETMMTEIIRKR